MSYLTAKDFGSPSNFKQVVDTTTVRSFDGGWNVIDNDLNMKSKYAVVLDNMERALDGTLALRPGTVLFSTLGSSTVITNHFYFNERIIVVQSDGVISAVNAGGTATVMQIAAANPWGGAVGSVLSVSFTIFNGDLIMSNGVHKPLIISGHPYVTSTGLANPNYNILDFLEDLGGTTGNTNTPIAKYVISHNRYTVFANLTAIAGTGPKPSSIKISSQDTSGTYPGDDPTHDAVEIDLGSRVSLGSSDITGLVAYRDKLMVTFERGVLLMNLGVYDTSITPVHTPTTEGFIEEFGCIAHRTLVSVGDDSFYCDNIGVCSVSRVTLFNTLRPERASQLIDPAITDAIQDLTAAQILKYVFSVYDMRNKRYMLFVPVFVDSVHTESYCFSYTNVPILKVEAWARLRGWKFTSACRTALQNIVFASDNKLYTYDFDNLTQNVDFRGDTALSTAGVGVPIAFDWELPWADFSKRMNSKQTTYVSMDTLGTATLTMSMYVDNIRVNGDGDDAPALSTEFQAGTAGGYGVQLYGSTPYGSGVPTADERLFAWPAKFKIAKFKVTGTTSLPLRIVSLSIAYMGGSIRR